MKAKRLLALLSILAMIVSVMPTTIFAYEEEWVCPHTNVTYIDVDEIAPTCFEPGVAGYWYCDECGQFLDKNKENGFWEEILASKNPALGHAFNTDTGKCDNCNIPNPVYTRITSLDDVNEEDMYIVVANVGDRYFVLGGLDESTANNEQGVIDCVESGNAVEVTPYADGSISLLNQNYVGNARPSEFMFDIDPEHLKSDLDDNFGLTPVLLKLDNYCVYPFQSYYLQNTGYMGIPRYANDVYGMWDATEWIIDFYTTEVDENTYRDDMDGLTHAEQVARGNIGENISEGDLLLYRGSYYCVGGAMFTLRFRERVNLDGVTEYYFICGEDWCLEGSDGWDYITDTTPTNDIQYGVSLYRYDVPAVETHTCEFGEWTKDNDSTHSRSCACGKVERISHAWGSGVTTGTASCGQSGEIIYTCDDCRATKTEIIPALVHNMSAWTSVDDANHTRHCLRDCGHSETLSHEFDDGIVTKEPTIKEEGVKTYTCDDCGYKKTEVLDKIAHSHDWSAWTDSGDDHTRTCQTAGCGATESLAHAWDEGTVTKDPTEDEKGIKTFTCSDCFKTKEEPIAELGHEHSWGDWVADGEDNHYCTCRCEEKQTQPHAWGDGEVMQAPTHTVVGQIKYVCSDCFYERFVDMPTTDEHEWSEWEANDETTHIRRCPCGESETDAHSLDDGVIVEQPTHTSNGIKRFNCADCGYTKREQLPATEEHNFGQWIGDATVAGKHYRECACGEIETGDCNWDEGTITKEPSNTEEGIKTYTCSLCAQTKSEAISKLVSKIENADAGVTLDVPTNSQASLPAGTVIDVVEKPVEEIPEQVLGEIAVTAEGAAKPLGMYDLSLLLDGAEIQPNGAVVITLPAPDLAAEYDRIIVVYIAPDGSYEECKTTVNEDGTISFETDHFSNYALVGITAADGNNGLGVGAIIGIVLGAMALIGGGFCLYWFVIRKKINK